MAVMVIFGMILFLLFLYVIPTLPLTLLFWFLGRKRANWLKKRVNIYIYSLGRMVAFNVFCQYR